MRAAVFTGGPDIDVDRAACIAASCDVIYAADGGADTALSANVIPSKVIGDMDSISLETRSLLEKLSVPVEVFPVEKDMTDTELCINALPEDSEIVLISSFTGRPDHALSNIMMAVKMRSEGRDITVTDGKYDFIPLCGPDELSIEGIQNPESLAVSIIPFTRLSGVTAEGLYYKLDNAVLTPGSSLSVSNRIDAGKDSFSLKISEGQAGIVLSPL